MDATTLTLGEQVMWIARMAMVEYLSEHSIRSNAENTAQVRAEGTENAGKPAGLRDRSLRRVVGRTGRGRG